MPYYEQEIGGILDLEQFLYEEYGLSSLALARLFLSHDLAVRKLNPPDHALSRELYARFAKGRLDTDVIRRLASKRDLAWQAKPRTPALDAAVNLYLHEPSTFKLVKRIFLLDQAAIEERLDFTFNNRVKLDDLPPTLPKEFGQIMCQINAMHRPSKALVETLELRRLHIERVRYRKSRHEACLAHAKSADSRFGTFEPDSELIRSAENALRLALADKGESSDLRRKRLGDDYRRTDADIVDDIASSLGLDIRIYGLSERYQHELFPGFEGRRFSEIFLEIARDDPNIFVQLMLRADYWWSRECSKPRDVFDAAELMFKFYFHELDMTYFWAVIAEGDWSKTGIHVHPWEDIKIVKLTYLAEQIGSTSGWLRAFVQIASSPNVKRFYKAHTRRAGQSWDDDLRWRT